MSFFIGSFSIARARKKKLTADQDLSLLVESFGLGSAVTVLSLSLYYALTGVSLIGQDSVMTILLFFSMVIMVVTGHRLYDEFV